MTFGVLIHRFDSVYEDVPEERYQFPKIYLSRLSRFVGSWIIYYEPTKVANSRGYFATAKVERIVPDPTKEDMYLAVIEPGSFLEFPSPVMFSNNGHVVETGLLNEQGKVSGRAQAAVREISTHDFASITDIGFKCQMAELPRVDDMFEVKDASQAEFIFEQDRERVATKSNRLVRDRLFRDRVLNVYDSRCALTGFKLINGGGRAEVQAAHVKPVSHNGPDSVRNGIALSGTVHWMFDRGLVSLSDSFDILISRQVNDRDGLERLINTTKKAAQPKDIRHQIHPAFISWHRENVFKL